MALFWYMQNNPIIWKLFNKNLTNISLNQVDCNFMKLKYFENYYINWSFVLVLNIILFG